MTDPSDAGTLATSGADRGHGPRPAAGRVAHADRRDRRERRSVGWVSQRHLHSTADSTPLSRLSG